MTLRLSRAELLRRLPLAVVVAGIVFVLLWLLFLAPSSTTKGSLLHNPEGFLKVLLDSITFAGVLFIVASGFTLIFGLMRVVNMAHGAFYLFAGFIAVELQRDFVGGGSGGGLGGGLVPDQVNTGNWVFPLLIAAASIGIVGLVTHQVFLRWNQGQELRQALITIAIAIIVVDQLEDPVGVGKDISWPGTLDGFINLHVAGIQYSIFRLFMLGLAIAIGIALWLWLHRTRTGMIIRAGVDDRQMVSALGVNVQLIFAISFVVGSVLVGIGGGIGGTQFGLQTHTTDAQWLLNSLIVVIIGGMGSLGGAAVGALLYGLVSNFSPVYLPTITSASGTSNCCTEYSIIFTFALLVVVLALRPLGLFGRPA